MAGDEREDGLLAALRRFRAHRERLARERPRSLARNLALAGVLGWTVVTPPLLGILLGRWLDRRAGSGVFWTASLVFAGAVVGCWLAWRRLTEE